MEVTIWKENIRKRAMIGVTGQLMIGLLKWVAISNYDFLSRNYNFSPEVGSGYSKIFVIFGS